MVRELHREAHGRSVRQHPVLPNLCLALVLGTQCPQNSNSPLTFSKAGRYRLLALSFAKEILASLWSGKHVTTFSIISVRSIIPSVYMSILKDKIIHVVQGFQGFTILIFNLKI